MDRRNFLKRGILSLSMVSIGSYDLFSKDKTESDAIEGNVKKDFHNRINGKILNACYHRAHMYTFVPRHVKEDLAWMADLGTDCVTISVLEQDFTAAIKNIDFICNEAEKLGMGLMAIPSRWGGMIAGSPKVPSVFSIQNPDTWVMNKNGEYVDTPVSGRISSVHHPKSLEFFIESVDKLFRQWNFRGVIWDELKTLTMDYSPAAMKNMNNNPTLEKQIKANADFYSKVNKYIKENFAGKSTSLFVYSQEKDEIINGLVKTEFLDYFGCDGRPWRLEDGGQLEGKGKVLVGHQGQRFIDAAKKNGKSSLFLIENHNLRNSDIPLLEKRMPELLDMDIDHLMYYYYPRNIEDPDKLMNIMRKHLINWK